MHLTSSANEAAAFHKSLFPPREFFFSFSLPSFLLHPIRRIPHSALSSAEIVHGEAKMLSRCCSPLPSLRPHAYVVLDCLTE